MKTIKYTAFGVLIGIAYGFLAQFFTCYMTLFGCAEEAAALNSVIMTMCVIVGGGLGLVLGAVADMEDCTLAGKYNSTAIPLYLCCIAAGCVAGWIVAPFFYPIVDFFNWEDTVKGLQANFTITGAISGCIIATIFRKEYKCEGSVSFCVLAALISAGACILVSVILIALHAAFLISGILLFLGIVLITYIFKSIGL